MAHSPRCPWVAVLSLFTSNLVLLSLRFCSICCILQSFLWKKLIGSLFIWMIVENQVVFPFDLLCLFRCTWYFHPLMRVSKTNVACNYLSPSQICLAMLLETLLMERLASVVKAKRRVIHNLGKHFLVFRLEHQCPMYFRFRLQQLQQFPFLHFKRYSP